VVADPTNLRVRRVNLSSTKFAHVWSLPPVGDCDHFVVFSQLVWLRLWHDEWTISFWLPDLSAKPNVRIPGAHQPTVYALRASRRMAHVLAHSALIREAMRWHSSRLAEYFVVAFSGLGRPTTRHEFRRSGRCFGVTVGPPLWLKGTSSCRR
jgi:hypothetical protein